MLRPLWLLAAVAACSSTEDGRPPITDEPETTPVVSISATEQGPACAAGETRECRAYWTDAMKQLHCTQATQFCDSSGRWLECGTQP